MTGRQAHWQAGAAHPSGILQRVADLRPRPGSPFCYVVATIIVALAALVSGWLHQGDVVPAGRFLPLVIAVLMVSYLSGAGTSFYAVALATLAGHLILAERPTSLAGVAEAEALALLVGAAALGSFMAFATRSAEERAAALAAKAITDERRWRGLAEHLPALVAQAAPDGTTTYLSERWALYSGRPLDEILPNPLVLCHPDDLERTRATLNSGIEAGRPTEIEWRLRAADGSYRWHLGFISPIRHPSGRIVSWVGANIDVDDQRRAREDLERERDQIRLIADSMPVLIAYVDEAGRYRFNNRLYEEWFGHSQQDIRGRHVREVLGPDVYEIARPYLDRALSGELVEFEAVVPYVKRGRRHVQATYAPDTGPDGRVRGAFILVEDTTERTRAEEERAFLAEIGEALNSSLDYEETLRLLVRSLVPALGDYACVYVRESDGSIGRSASAYIKEEWAALSAYPVDPNGAAGAAHVLRTGKPELCPRLDERVMRSAAGSDEHMRAMLNAGLRSAMAVPMKLRDEVMGCFAVVRIDSEQEYDERDLELAMEVGGRAAHAIDRARLYWDTQRALDELRRANAAKDEFLGLVSHELKTPITTILGNADVLLRLQSRIGEEMRNEALTDVRREAERLHRIIENLLVLARLDRGQRIEHEPILMRRLLPRIVEEHQRRYPQRDIVLHLPEGLAPVLASADYVEQVVHNLLSNAEKYSSSGAPIELRVEMGEREIQVSVLDRGVGVEQDEEDAIFTPFYRSPRTSSHAQGVGIGLAVCKRLIEVQGGRVWARPRPGGGSDIGFALPVTDEDDEV